MKIFIIFIIIMNNLIDIEDINYCNTHKKDNFTLKQWELIVYELKEHIDKIKATKDLCAFRLFMQNKYKIILSNSNLIKAFNMLDNNDQHLKYILTKKKINLILV